MEEPDHPLQVGAKQCGIVSSGDEAWAAMLQKGSRDESAEDPDNLASPKTMTL